MYPKYWHIEARIYVTLKLLQGIDGKKIAQRIAQ